MLSTSPISASVSPRRATSNDDGWQQFAQLVRAVNAGDLTAAQKAYSNFSESHAGEMVRAHPQGRMAQAMDQVGNALNAGNIEQAQQALTIIRPRSETPTVAAPSITPPADPNAPGGKLNLIV